MAGIFISCFPIFPPNMSGISVPVKYGGPKVSSRSQNLVLAPKNLVLAKQISYSQKQYRTRKQKSRPCGEKSRLCTGH